MSRSIAEVLADPAASRWLKGALTSALDRDPVIAERDALKLRRLLSLRLLELELAREIADVLTDPVASGWLKDALSNALERDPVDAERDALKLRRVLADRRKLLELPSTHELDRVPGHL